jgi:hypothetical protein
MVRIDKLQRIQRRRLTGCGDLPGLAIIGRVENTRARRTGDPDILPLDGDGGEVEMIGSRFR